MIKKLILIVFIMVSVFFGKAQQEPTFTHYAFNPLAINPAFAGSKELLSIAAINRLRWVKFPGAPKTQTVTAHSILKTKSLGGGLSFINNSKGPYHATGIDLDLAYRLPLNNGRLSFGLKGGVRFVSIRLQSEVVTTDAGDAAFQSDVVMQPVPNVGFGVHYAVNDFYVGFAVPRLLQNDLNPDLTGSKAFEERNYYLMMAGAFNLNADKTVKLKPSVFFKVTQSTLFQIDATFLFYFNEKIWLGPMYRSTNDLGILAGLSLSSQFKFGYAFDWSFGNKTATYNSGSHELMLSYDFVFDKKQGVVSPRHF